MSREWQPGDVAMAHNERVFMDLSGEWRWVETKRVCLDQPPYGLRPLVVIDPEDREAVEGLLSAYLEHGWTRTPDDAPIRTTGIDYLQAALREYANPKPPKPDEPQGLGAVVEDEDGEHYIRTNPSAPNAWVPVDAGARAFTHPYRDYQHITAVRVLSPGVEVDQ